MYFVISDLNKDRANYAQARQNLVGHISSYSTASMMGLDSVWFVQASSTPDALDAHIGRHRDKNERLIVTRLVNGQDQGWSSKQVWDWINHRI